MAASVTVTLAFSMSAAFWMPASGLSISAGDFRGRNETREEDRLPSVPASDGSKGQHADATVLARPYGTLVEVPVQNHPHGVVASSSGWGGNRTILAVTHYIMRHPTLAFFDGLASPLVARNILMLFALASALAVLALMSSRGLERMYRQPAGAEKMGPEPFWFKGVVSALASWTDTASHNNGSTMCR